MAKRIGRKVYVYKFKSDGSPARIMFFCPACDSPHWLPTDGSYENPPGKVQNWTWNGNGDAPTFSPSLNLSADDPKHRCHSVTTEGKIFFCADSARMPGQTVDLPDWPDDESWDENGP